MSQQAVALAQKGVPWRRDVPWWIVGVEGAIIAIVGIYIVSRPDDAQDIVRQIIGWFLLVNACLAIVASLRDEGAANPLTPYRMLGAGIGLSVGLLVVLEPVSDYIEEDAARVALALGLLGHGLVGLAGAVATRASGGMRRGALIGALINIVLAALLFYNVRRETLDPRWFGYVAIAGGVLVLGYAYMRYAEAKAQAAAAGASAAAAGASPMAADASAEADWAASEAPADFPEETAADAQPAVVTSPPVTLDEAPPAEGSVVGPNGTSTTSTTSTNS